MTCFTKLLFLISHDTMSASEPTCLHDWGAANAGCDGVAAQ